MLFNYDFLRNKTYVRTVLACVFLSSATFASSNLTNKSSGNKAVLPQVKQNNSKLSETKIPKKGDEPTPLMKASEKGDLEMVRLLLKNGASVNERNRLDETALYFAARSGYVEIVKELIQKGAIVDEFNNKTIETPLMSAAGYQRGYNRILFTLNNNAEDHLNVVRLLLKNGADINRKKPGCQAAISTASLGGDADMVKLLIENGANIKDCLIDRYKNIDNLYKIPDWMLNIAAKVSATLVMKYDTKMAEMVINKQHNDSRTPLMIAAQKNHVKVAQLLIEKDMRAAESISCFIIIPDNMDLEKVPLFISASVGGKNIHGEVDIYIYKQREKLLYYIPKLAGGLMYFEQQIIANPGVNLNDVITELTENKNFKNGKLDSESIKLLELKTNHKIANRIVDRTSINNRLTALMIASRNGSTDVVKLLLEKGASINKTDRDGMTALMHAVEAGQLNVVKTLLENGADFNKQTVCCRFTALMLASVNGHNDIVKILLKHGASAEEKGVYGITALILASAQGCTEVIKTLLDHGTLIDNSDQIGDTAFMTAVATNKIGVVKLLLEKGAAINKKDTVGESTALTAASVTGNIEMVKLLLEKGAIINYQSKIGGNPLITASAMGHDNIVKLLLEKGAKTIINNEIHSADNTKVDALGGGVCDLISKTKFYKSIEKITEGDTALTIASINGHDKVVKLLLENGANSNKKNKNGFSALDLAKQNNQKACVTVLEGFVENKK